MAKSKRSSEAEFRRHIKKDAQAKDREEGCVCTGVSYRVHKTDDGYDVLSEPHNPDCLLAIRKAENRRRSVVHPWRSLPRWRANCGPRS